MENATPPSLACGNREGPVDDAIAAKVNEARDHSMDLVRHNCRSFNQQLELVHCFDKGEWGDMLLVLNIQSVPALVRYPSTSQVANISRYIKLPNIPATSVQSTPQHQHLLPSQSPCETLPNSRQGYLRFLLPLLPRTISPLRKTPSCFLITAAMMFKQFTIPAAALVGLLAPTALAYNETVEGFKFSHWGPTYDASKFDYELTMAQSALTLFKTRLGDKGSDIVIPTTKDDLPAAKAKLHDLKASTGADGMTLPVTAPVAGFPPMPRPLPTFPTCRRSSSALGRCLPSSMPPTTMPTPSTTSRRPRSSLRVFWSPPSLRAGAASRPTSTSRPLVPPTMSSTLSCALFPTTPYRVLDPRS